MGRFPFIGLTRPNPKGYKYGFRGSGKVKGMDSKTAYRILGLDSHVSIAELRQTYRDLVNVWHPDRFAHNPRLRRKAENRLKEINEAYRHLRGTTAEPTPEPPPGPEPDSPGGEAAAGAGETGKPPGAKKKTAKRPSNSIWNWPGRHRWVSMGLGTAALLLLAFVLWGPGPEPEPPPTAIAESEPLPPPYGAEPEPPRTPSEWPAWLVRLQKKLEWADKFGEGAGPPETDSGAREEDPAEGLESETAADGDSEVDAWPSLIPPEMSLPPIRDVPQFPDEVGPSRPAPEPRPERHAALPPPEPAPARRLSPEVVRLRSRVANQVRARGDRYRDRGDGTVLDRRTGRVWTLSNSYLETGRLLSFDEAARYVRSLNTGGYGDWRLPRSDELAEIYLNGLRYPTGGAPVLWSSEVYVKGWHNVVRVIEPDLERVAMVNQSVRGVVHAVRP